MAKPKLPKDQVDKTKKVVMKTLGALAVQYPGAAAVRQPAEYGLDVGAAQLTGKTPPKPPKRAKKGRMTASAQLPDVKSRMPGRADVDGNPIDGGDAQLPPADQENDDVEVEMHGDNDGDEGPDVEENDDGSANVYMDKKDVAPDIDSAEFDANLAEVLPDHVLDRLADKYMQRIEDAIEARKKRDEMYEEGLKRSGLGGPAPGGAEFEGASRVTHPVLAEAYVDFSASTMKELFPSQGPVRTQIEGDVNSDKIDKAQRKAAYMNHQLTKDIPEYRSELEILLTQLPAGGSQFLKIYWDDSLNRAVVDFVGIDEVVLPFNAKGFARANFKFHRLKKDEYDVDRDIANGLYRDVNLTLPAGFDEMTKTETENNKIEGKDFNWGANEDGQYILYEGTVMEDEFDDPMRPEDKTAPYIITIDEGSNKVLGLYRNWDQKDQKCEDIPYMVEFKFIPWRGAYGIGLPHLIGDLSAALTGCLRALLDSAHIQNSATAIKLKGRPGGETLSMSPTQVGEVDALAGDDIRKIIMPLAFNGPSPVLLQLLGFLEKGAKGVVTTSEEKVADATGDMPVGTTLALIEQGAKVFSSIHARLHESQHQALLIVHRLNYEHLPEKLVFGTGERDFILKQDFDGPMDIHPVSDPNIFSETQRFAQMQAVMAMAEKAPNIMSLQKCYERMLQLMKIPDYKELLLTPPKPTSQNAAAENVQMAMGKPVAAFPDQDHLAHIQVHLDFLKDPMFGMSQMMAKQTIPAMVEHLKQHMLFYYANLMQLEGKQNLGADISQTVNQDKSWQTDRNVSEALAHSSPVVMKALESAFADIPKLLQSAQQFLSQLAQQQQQDPAFQIAMAELQQRKQEHQDEMQFDNKKLIMNMQKMMKDQEFKVNQLQANMQKFAGMQKTAKSKVATEALVDMAKGKSDNANDLLETRMDNATAIEIAEMRGGSNMTNGKSMTH